MAKKFKHPGDEHLRRVIGDNKFDKNKNVPSLSADRKAKGKAIEGLHDLPERDSEHDDVSPEQQAENIADIPKGQPGSGDRV